MKSKGNKQGRHKRLASADSLRRMRQTQAAVEFVEQTDGYLPARKVPKNRKPKR